MVGFLTNKIGREELQAGDHIYSWCSAYLYSHHGIYIGDEKVIHRIRATGTGTGTMLDNLLFSTSHRPTSHTGNTCQRCTDAQHEHLRQQPRSPDGGVVITCLDCFLGRGHLYLFTYSVSPVSFLAKARGGTCSLADSDPPNLVLHRAHFLLNHGFGSYRLCNNNCEDFAIYCKTGLLIENSSISFGRSGQVGFITAVLSAFTLAPLRFLNYKDLAGVTAGLFCAGRYVADIGIRKDAIKVPVEEIVEHAEP